MNMKKKPISCADTANFSSIICTYEYIVRVSVYRSIHPSIGCNMTECFVVLLPIQFQLNKIDLVDLKYYLFVQRKKDYCEMENIEFHNNKPF